MRVTVRKITNIEDAREAIASTVDQGFESKCELDQLYCWEHSPSRSQLFVIHMYDVPTYISVHMVRHAAVGQQHYVKSNRPDRGGAGDDVVTRNTPIDHMMILNAQHLLDMGKKRLCYKAAEGTREVMSLIKSLISDIDPALANYMVPNCVYRGGYCSEPKPCGKYKVKRYNPAEILRGMVL